MSLKEELIAAGFNIHVAEALAENDVTVDRARAMSAEDCFNLFLQWNGIIGYTSMIIDALDNCRNVEAL